MNNIWTAPSGDLQNAKQLTFGSFGRYDGLWGLDFTPDGEITYTNSDTDSQIISKMDAGGGNVSQLSTPGLIESSNSVSRDGKYIVFLSIKNGGMDVWRMNTDGTNKTQLTFTQQCFQPFISADSQFVYCKFWGDGVGGLRRVPMAGGEATQFTHRETSWGDASPDGRYIAAGFKTDKRRLAIFAAETGDVVSQFEMPENGTTHLGVHWSPDSKAVLYLDAYDGIWKQEISGGEPRRVEGLPHGKYYNFVYSKDGQQLAFVRGSEIRDVVMFIKGN